MIRLGSLSLDQLRMLVSVADAGSFSAAGLSLGRAQSAVSQALAKLEEMHGVEIFDRTGRRAELTQIGRALVDQARLVLASAGRFEALAANSRAGIEAELAIAIDPLVPTAPLIESLQALRFRFPELSVSFSTEGLNGGLRRLRDGTAMVALCLLLPVVPEDVIALPLRQMNLRPTVAVDHALARRTSPIAQSELESYVQLILSDPVEARGPSYGLASPRHWRFVDIGRRLDFLRAGFGWCRMPEELVARDVRDGRLVHFEIEHDTAPPDGVTIYAAYPRDRVPGPAARWLLEHLQNSLPPRPPGKPPS